MPIWLDQERNPFDKPIYINPNPRFVKNNDFFMRKHPISQYLNTPFIYFRHFIEKMMKRSKQHFSLHRLHLFFLCNQNFLLTYINLNSLNFVNPKYYNLSKKWWNAASNISSSRLSHYSSLRMRSKFPINIYQFVFSKFRKF